MENIKEIADQLQGALKKMKDINAQVMNQIKDQEPEKVAEIMKDHSKIFKAIEQRDVTALNKLYSKYADQSNK